MIDVEYEVIMCYDNQAGEVTLTRCMDMPTLPT